MELRIQLGMATSIPTARANGANDSSSPLSTEELRKINAYWRAANYLSVGQIYLYANPLLREPLKIEHIKPRLLGHWGTTPGLNFIYVHFNRLIKKHDLNVIYIAGPGHGGPGMVANTYLEGTYSEFYPQHSRKTKRACRSCSSSFRFRAEFPATPRRKLPARFTKAANSAIRSLHAYGAAFDNPDLLVCCVVGDGEAETGPLAASWHSNKFLNPARDGAVLPILHLNGYKIANPTVLARMTDAELTQLFTRLRLQAVFCGGPRARSHAPADGRDARYRHRRNPEQFRKMPARKGSGAPRRGR